MNETAQLEAVAVVAPAGHYEVAQSIREDRDAGRLVYDDSDRPTCGTACDLCRLKCGEIPAHSCPAKGFLRSATPQPDDPITDYVEWAVCAECGAGQPCGHAVALERMRRGLGEFDLMQPEVNVDPGHRVDLAEVGPVAPAAPVQSDWKIKDSLSVDNLRTVPRSRAAGRVPQRRERLQVVLASAEPKRVPAARREKLDVVRKDEVKAMAGMVSDEVRAAIKAAPASVKTCDLVKQYGVPYGTVFYIRKPNGAEKKAARPAKKAAVKQAPKPVTAAAAARPIVDAIATLQVPEIALDRLFAALTLGSKTRAIQFVVNEGLV